MEHDGKGTLNNVKNDIRMINRVDLRPYKSRSIIKENDDGSRRYYFKRIAVC